LGSAPQRKNKRHMQEADPHGKTYEEGSTRARTETLIH